MNPVWQQRKLVEFGKANGIVITAFSPLGGIGSSWGTNRVMDDETLNHIAKAHGKTVAQVSLHDLFLVFLQHVGCYFVGLITNCK